MSKAQQAASRVHGDHAAVSPDGALRLQEHSPVRLSGSCAGFSEGPGAFVTSCTLSLFPDDWVWTAAWPLPLSEDGHSPSQLTHKPLGFSPYH